MGLTNSIKVFFTGLKQRLETQAESYPPQEQFYVFVRTYAIVYTGSFHFFLIFLFWGLKVYPMAYFNVLSAATYALAYYLEAKNDSNRFHMFLAFLEVLFHAVLVAYFVGADIGFQYYLIFLVFLSFMHPAGKRGWTYAYIPVSAIAFVWIYYYSQSHTPIYVLEHSQVVATNVFNIVGLFGTCTIFLFFLTSSSEGYMIEAKRQHDRAELRTKELADALEQQIATADVLKTISSSTFDLNTVLEAIVKNAVRLARATLGGVIFMIEKDSCHAVVQFGGLTQLLEHLKAHPISLNDMGSITSRAVAKRQPVQVEDTLTDPHYSRPDIQKAGGSRTLLGVPILREGVPIGVLTLGRLEICPYNEKEIQLAASFADQAAIAIENVRMFREIDEKNRKVEQRTKDLSQANGELKQTLDSLKQAQKQLVQSEKMASLGALVAGVAHEINTPVGIGVTAASHLEDETKRLLSLYQQGQMKKTDLDQYLAVSEQSSRMILNNLARAADLIHSFKQVAVDQSSENLRRFKVRSYLEEILTSLRPVLKKTKLSCTIDCPDDIEIESFPGAFSQVITNLVMNALKHAYDDSSEGVIRIALRKNDDHLELGFSDDGKGMSADILGKIFDPFFTTKRGTGGSGLGMHIVYNLITQTLQGGIECRSQPGQGTTFNIHWPVGA